MEIDVDTTALHRATRARGRRFPSPCRIAPRAEDLALNTSVGARTANIHAWAVVPKAQRLSRGDIAATRIMPARPRIRLRRLIARQGTRGSAEDDMSRTELWRVFRRVMLPMRSIVEDSRDMMPTPAVPIQIATSFVRTTEQIIVSIWMLPKMLIVFRIRAVSAPPL